MTTGEYVDGCAQVDRPRGLVSSAPRPRQWPDGPDDWRPEFPDTNFERTSIDYDEIVTDGPRRDQIPPIDYPRFAPVADADISPLEPVLSVINEDWSVVARHVRFRADTGRKVECAVTSACIQMRKSSAEGFVADLGRVPLLPPASLAVRQNAKWRGKVRRRPGGPWGDP